jgi:hypothetical protein
VYLTKESGSIPDQTDYFDDLPDTGPSGPGSTLNKFVE